MALGFREKETAYSTGLNIRQIMHSFGIIFPLSTTEFAPGG
jgi:hypothetical protein